MVWYRGFAQGSRRHFHPTDRVFEPSKLYSLKAPAVFVSAGTLPSRIRLSWNDQSDLLLAMAAQIPIIDAARCSGCGRCIAACHLRLFAFEQQGWRKVSVLQDSERCSGCALCAAKCPIDAIAMEKKLAPHYQLFGSPLICCPASA